MIYFDNAATSYPKPSKVAQSVYNAFNKYGANPGRSGHKMAMATAVQVYNCREKAARFFHIEQPEHVVFCNNATHAINLAIKGVLLNDDHVIISDLEHNAVLRPVHTLSEKGLISYSIAETVVGDDDATILAFEKLINPKTRMIICTHGSNVFGVRLPIEKINLLAKKYNLYILVDASQTAGIVDIDASNIDFLCTAGHKSLYGPTGTGLLITSLGDRLGTIIEGGTGSFSAHYSQPNESPDRLESGTCNSMGIIGLSAGFDFVMKKSIESIYTYEMKLAEEIYLRLKKIDGVKLYTDNFILGDNLPVISFNINGLHSEQVGDILSDNNIAVRAGLHCAPLAHKKLGTIDSGTVRISVGAFNNIDEINILCNNIKKIAFSHCIT